MCLFVPHGLFSAGFKLDLKKYLQFEARPYLEFLPN